MTVREGNVCWTFPDGWSVEKYDAWAFYRNRFQQCAGGGTRAADFVALPPTGDTLWVIEAKDYTFEPRDEEKEPVGEEVARKSRDTLAGLVAAAANADEPGEQAFAAKALLARRIRVVLHLEQPTTRTRLYPVILDRADVQQKLKQVVRSIDPHPKVVDVSSAGGLPWTVAWDPIPRNR